MYYAAKRKSTMIENEIVEQAKRVPIVAYLNSRGITPVNSTGVQYVYCSPFKDERTASFYVHAERNVFNCFATGEKGDAIRLVSLLENYSFPAACSRLLRMEPTESVPFSLSGSKSHVLQPEQHRQEITDVRPLQHKALVQYVESRGIPFEVAFKYLSEIHYTHKGRNFFGCGFQTDKGSWAVRSGNFKTWIGATDITTIEVPDSKSVNLFEGFFDFLSYVTYYRVKQLRSTVIVLNSTTNISKAIPRMQQAATVVNCLMDNDNAGRSAFCKLHSSGLNVIDRSNVYADHNDFNDFLTALL